MMRFLLIFLILYSIFILTLSKKVICDSPKIINISQNEIIFIESPNFPETLTNLTKKECRLKINSNESEKMELIFVMTNGYVDGAEISDGIRKKTVARMFSDLFYFSTNEKYFNFSFVNFTNTKWMAFQGFITLEKINEKACPFSERNPAFNFTDDTEIIYIRSSWKKQKQQVASNNNSDRICKWNFHIPLGYQFKFIALNNLSYPDIPLRITENLHNTTDEIYLLQSENPYYLTTTNVTITHTDNNELNYKTFHNEDFRAYVSVIKFSNEKVNLNCSIKKVGNKTIWTNIAERSGYPNNAKCTTIIRVEPNQIVTAWIKYFVAEQNIDTLSYYDTEFKTKVLTYEKTRYNLQPQQNGNAKDYEWIFLTDGSLRCDGFIVEFTPSECKCNYDEIIVPCEEMEYDYFIMENDQYYYCSNLSCNITIAINETCPNKYLAVKTNAKFNDDGGHFKIISNNLILLDSNLKQRNALIVPGSKTRLDFHSSKYVQKEYAYITFIPIERPRNIGINILTENEPIYKTNLEILKENSAFTIQLSNELKNKNDIIELHKVPWEKANLVLRCFTIYTDENFTHPIGTLNNFDEEKIVSLTIYQQKDCKNREIILFFRAKNAQSKNCMYKQTLYQMKSHTFEKRVTSMISSKHGQCEYILINHYPKFLITNLWTNSKTKNVKLLTGFKNGTEIFSFNRFNSLLWQNIIIPEMFYTVIIPPGSSVILTLDFHEKVIKLPSHPFLSSYQTTDFGELYNAEHTSLIYEIGTINITFTLVDLDISSKGFLQIIDFFSKKKTNFTKVGDSQTFYNTSVRIFYKENQKEYYDGAFIRIQGIPNIQAISTTNIPTTLSLNPSPSTQVSMFDIMFEVTEKNSNVEKKPKFLLLIFLTYFIFNFCIENLL